MVHPFGPDPVIMGIVNVTPDSFSDGGKFYSKNNAIGHGQLLAEQGATILDIGGESTRPGAQVIDPDEEISRVVPVIEGLRGKAPFISIDTRNAKTMRAALAAGANCINDVSGLTHDDEAMGVVAEANVPVFIMHSQGTPQDMQKNPSYNNVVDDVYAFFEERISACRTARIETKNLVLDVGIGFGKTLEHNVLLLRNIKKFHDFGCKLLLGTSRKSFIAALSNGEPPESRQAGSLASALWGLSQGVQIFRVHDVAETAQAFRVWQGIQA
ncbi:MAG TPA: dihydropteroate synthase [Alphaproteobacteria bacterium]|nr:dihydropteroate synthase [Alphaproteobacteria bacterium]